VGECDAFYNDYNDLFKVNFREIRGTMRIINAAMIFLIFFLIIVPVKLLMAVIHLSYLALYCVLAIVLYFPSKVVYNESSFKSDWFRLLIDKYSCSDGISIVTDLSYRLLNKIFNRCPRKGK